MFLKTSQIECLIHFYDLEKFGMFVSNALVELQEMQNYDRFFKKME